MIGYPDNDEDNNSMNDENEEYSNSDDDLNI